MGGATKTDNESVALRFWPKIRKTDSCWLWEASCQIDGYGQFALGMSKIHAHRISWILHYGDIPAGLQVNHRCDVRACVRPDHLFLGTQRDNVHDCIRKGRSVDPPRLRGEEVSSSKLTWRDVKEMRMLFTGTHGQIKKFAERYGVTRHSVRFALSGKTWKEATTT